ncbi:DUF4280 domain-containing protein [Chryseobacterium polytrichastri]|uniref:LysM domain-containing protein n=1 Tax=Chryseobacterium polytrichastri TaxID=1302687 RepID=A0A1M6PHE6_9FLAO|nr:DUF4280 domain-containing protein [Chryseobacterium polytrichastri]SHK07369.1 protein of unknown function [Chryseobacterium polytrichastri]
MKNYTIQQGDTFNSLSQKFNIKDDGVLKTYHNLHCPIEDVMQEPIPGKQIIIPENPDFFETKDPTSENPNDEVTDPMNGYDEVTKNESEATESANSQKSEKEETEKAKQENKTSNHDGKYFVIQKGKAQCNQGNQFPQFKVSSHQRHYFNDSGNDSDYLAVTENDLQFNPSGPSFGQCKLKPSSGGNLPCAFAPAGKWQKVYEKTKVEGQSCLSEISELMCSTGGKITVLKHGQQSELSKKQVAEADTREQQVYNPIVDFEEFKEDINGTDELYYV